MIKTLLTLLLTFSVFQILAQNIEDYTTKDSLRFVNEVNNKAKKLRNELEKKDDYENDYMKKKFIDFQIDTFKVEEFYRKQIEFNYSTANTIDATCRAELEYDKLLNKQYKVLMVTLKGTDKEILKKAQLNWLKYRDSELELSSLLGKDEYSGGGTMQGIIYADRKMSLTKDRVINLFQYQ